ncbi:hypothetical protein Goklo_016580 [Gossypium klotzschianum]|uniref:Reverse transcriptase zinc-binding domain-containing protein n=1 Tax=Gossypium klotzschianum TaxID=34286 RepID=A0A7J8UF94_9ROSI|nr:hypothetical protein [Gossypium klotzschianum]
MKSLGVLKMRNGNGPGSFFIWTVLKERLLSNVERVKRGLIVNPSCPICGHDLEDILHIIRDCTTAKAIWRQGLKLIQRGGHDKVIIQSDRLEVVKALQ